MFPVVMFQLSEPDQQFLLKIARESISEYLFGRAPRLPDVSGLLAEPRGAFVSLHKHSRLRGCIGNIHASAPLVRTVSECAITAAVGDPRFLPITLEELGDVDLEISVLSPMEKVENVDTIEVGRDGLLIVKRTARGLLLPQVASQYGWHRERFLAETCRKAGLRADDWKDGASIYRFTAHAFGDDRKQASAHI
jgi:AmmeMemoRadiSam system protein A